MPGSISRNYTGVLALGVLLTISACQEGNAPTSVPADNEQAALSVTAAASRVQQKLIATNQKLASRHAKFRAAYVEYLTTGAKGQIGQIVFASDRGNKHLGISFAPNDTRRHPGNNITYLVDQSDASPDGLTAAQVTAAIDRAENTWEAVKCSRLVMDRVPDSGADPDIFDGQVGFGAIGTPFADITHAGWYPAVFFNTVFGPGASDAVIAFTIPFFFVDDNGNPTDINHDGDPDEAFAEIYYNDAFPWGINTPFPIDVQSVALHESGHALGQAHFGKIFETLANGRIHFAPRATMNASYSNDLFGDLGAQHLSGSDIGGHCSLWASWPQR
jgi:hypothetical protein